MRRSGSYSRRSQIFTFFAADDLNNLTTVIIRTSILLSATAFLVSLTLGDAFTSPSFGVRPVSHQFSVGIMDDVGNFIGSALHKRPLLRTF
jgi:hypothetical protein